VVGAPDLETGPFCSSLGSSTILLCEDEQIVPPCLLSLGLTCLEDDIKVLPSKHCMPFFAKAAGLEGKGCGQLQSAVTDTLELDFNVGTSCLLSEKNGFHIVIPGTAPCEAANWFLFVVLVRCPQQVTCLTPHFFIQSTGAQKFTVLSLDYVPALLAQLISTCNVVSV